MLKRARHNKWLNLFCSLASLRLGAS